MGPLEHTPVISSLAEGYVACYLQAVQTHSSGAQVSGEEGEED